MSEDPKDVKKDKKEPETLDVDRLQLLIPATLKSEFPLIFTNVRVYGTVDDPLFVASDIGNALGIKDLHLHERLEWITEKVKIKIDTPGGKQKTFALTERGLYNIIYTSQTETSTKFRTFVYVILKELRLRGQVTLKTAIQKLDEKVDRLDRQLEEEHKEHIKQKEMAEHYYFQSQMVRENIDQAHGQIKRLEKSPDATSAMYLEKLKQEYMKPINIILVKPPKELEEDFDYNYEDEDANDDEQYILALSTAEFKDGQNVGKAYIHRTYKLSDLHAHLQTVGFGIKKEDGTFHQNRYSCSIEELRAEIDNLMEKFLL